MDDLDDLMLAHTQRELTKLALEHCERTSTQAFVIPSSVGDLCIAFGSRAQIAALLRDDGMTPYIGRR